MLNGFNTRLWLPLPLAVCQWEMAWISRAAKSDAIDTTFRVFNGGIITVAFRFIVASLTGMVWIFAQSMHPAVENFDAVARNGRDGLTGSCKKSKDRCRHGCRHGRRRTCGRNNWRMIGSMIPSGLGGKATVPVFLMFVEVGLEIGPCVFHDILVIPGSKRVAVYSSLLEGKECEFDGGSVGDDRTASSSSSLDDPNAFPEILEGCAGAINCSLARIKYFAAIIATPKCPFNPPQGQSERSACWHIPLSSRA
jgi:hypothetical protein